MPKYQIQLKETITYTMEIEADDAGIAQAEALDAWAQSEDPFGEFSGNSSGAEVKGICFNTAT
ncbi:hypothetical protein [Pseudochrobactrum asaccharolyticum]|uniref:Uncharacterized protein n=1 Tax=Pseudochrobactrum asaccharolyticum TaxID=354351 RepID=A0A366DKD2_9HYPH|nr:hypothetical protein [Pseudochrobactrum asaccharolyticum]RBO90491.1 hypothetical protein DFR47_11352 [Pseudochrobactrum asaccharolyticum]